MPDDDDKRYSHCAAGRLLIEASRILEDREESYGSPNLLFEALSKRWSMILGTKVTPTQVVLCMIDLKMVRLMHNPRHRDSAVDIAGYAALLEELDGDGVDDFGEDDYWPDRI